MHRPDYATPSKSLAAFDTLVQQGKVIYVGMSTLLLAALRGRLKSEMHRWAPPVVTRCRTTC